MSSPADRVRAALDAMQAHEAMRTARWVWGASKSKVDILTSAGVPLLRGLPLELGRVIMMFARTSFALADAVPALLDELNDLEGRADAAEDEVSRLRARVRQLERDLELHDQERPAEAWARERFKEARLAKAEAERLARSGLDRKVLS